MRSAAPRLVALALALGLSAAFASRPEGGGPVPRRADAKAYAWLDATRRFPKIGQGASEQVLALDWRPAPHRPDNAGVEGPGRRRLIAATCDADLVVIARPVAETPFRHPNGRWILTAHDLDVTSVVRSARPDVATAGGVRYVHPSGTLVQAGKAYRTVVDRFPPLVSDEERLFFLVRIGQGNSYRASGHVPVAALRGGLLFLEVLETAAGERQGLDGLSARDALRTINGAVCRPTPPRTRAPASRHPEAGRPSTTDRA